MRVAFRVDSSIEIGTGHVMRCLTLADALREGGANCEFVCRANPGHLGGKIEESGYRVHMLPGANHAPRILDSEVNLHSSWLNCSWSRDSEETQAALAHCRPDWLVVDHYAIEAHWEQSVRAAVGRIMAIDDLADRRHECDLLLDQNLGRSSGDYERLVPARTRCLIGPEYALLRPQFASLRGYSLARRRQGNFERILVSFGGTDRDNLTGRVLKRLSSFKLPGAVHVDVVIGQFAPALPSVKALAGRLPFRCEVRVAVHNMAQVMAEADLAIGAAGSSAWERCALGLPAIVIVAAENQRGIADALKAAGAADTLAVTEIDSIDGLEYAVTRFADPEVRTRYSSAAGGLVDGLGVERVRSAMGDMS